MQESSSEEYKPSKRVKGRKRCTRIDNSDSEEENENNNNSSEQENSSDNKNICDKEELEEIKKDVKNKKNEKQIELQKKLKFIVNEVREKGKYEYNKQEIPENLKYHSDESDSSQGSGTKKSTLTKKNVKTINDNNDIIEGKNSQNIKTQLNTERQTSKITKSKKSKDTSKLGSLSSRKKSNNKNKEKEKDITDFVEEDNIKKDNDKNEYKSSEKKEKRNQNVISNDDSNGKKIKIIKKKNNENNYENNDEKNYEPKESTESAKVKKKHYKKFSIENMSNNQKNVKNSETAKKRKKISKLSKDDEDDVNDINEEKNKNKDDDDDEDDEENAEKVEKKEKNLKLKNLLENKKDIILQKNIDKEKKQKEKKEEKKEEREEKEDKEKNLSSKRKINKKTKSKEEEIIEPNNDNEENKEDSPKKENKKNNNVRNLIELLKAKKNEREDLVRQEKEAEEQSIMRGKNQKKNNKENIEEKATEEDTEVERETEKIRLREKKLEERRLAREKRRKMEEEEKKRKEKEFEEKKRKEEERKKKEEERKRKEEERKKKEEERKKKEEEERRKREEQEEEERLRKKREKQRKEEEKELKRIKINEKEHLKERSRSRKNSEKIEYGNNNLNLPKKIYKDEEENDEEENYSNLNNKNDSKKNYKYSTGKKLNKEEEKRRKQLEKDLEDEINKNELSDENEKNKNKNNNINKNVEINKNERKEIEINENTNNKIEKSYDGVNTYKKPVQKNFVNGKTKIYRPKRPGGIMRGRSHERVDQHLISNLENSQGANINQNYAFTSMNSKKLNGNNFLNSPKITYSKKRSIGGIRGENNFLQLNKSFGEYRGSGLENGNNFMNGMYNINTLELSSLPDLNSSFDSRMLSYNNNNNLRYNLNNEYFNRTAQKNYHNNTINSNNIINNSNRLTNMNNFFGMNNIGNLNNINGLKNGENDNFINMSNMNLNNSNSFYDLRQTQLNTYDLNNSYNIGYNNPLSNYQNNQVNLSNFLGNNYLGLNNRITNYNSGINNYQAMIAKKSSSINIEDLLVLEEKLNEISTALNKTKIMHNECFEFWNYYFNCSLYGSLEKLFTNVMDSNNVQISINYILMSILICYDCSFDIDVLNSVYSVLKELLSFNHKNLMLIYEHILSKISTESRDNIWVLKLFNIVNSSKNSEINDFNLPNGYSMSLVEKINFNTGIIIQNIRVLLKNYKTPRVEYLTSLFKKISEKTYEDINIFFRQYLLRVDNMNGSILASVYLKENTDIKSEPAPYLHTVNHKPYSLVLDLDETLVHFKVNPDNESEGVLKVRPGVMEFLEEVDKYYELIIFTCATQDYANLLIDAIEENKIYFEHRLYRQHTVIIDNDFVKDLTRIGRPLDKIAIVDNMPQNFRLQKENGINIKAFWGEDIYDTALINLSPILIKIAKEGGDIRKGLSKYRDEIVEKVTSNISKQNV